MASNRRQEVFDPPVDRSVVRFFRTTNGDKRQAIQLPPQSRQSITAEPVVCSHLLVEIVCCVPPHKIPNASHLRFRFLHNNSFIENSKNEATFLGCTDQLALVTATDPLNINFQAVDPKLWMSQNTTNPASCDS